MRDYMGKRDVISSVRLVAVAFSITLLSGAALWADWDSTISGAQPLNWYRFNETEPTTAVDHGSGGANGTYVGDVVFGEPGLVDKAVLFEGVEGLEGGGALLIEETNLEGDWTVETIFSADVDFGSASQGLIGSAGDSPDERMAIKAEQWNSTETMGYTQFGVVDVDLGAPTPSELTYVAFVGTVDGVELYVDGESVAQDSAAPTLARYIIGAGEGNPDGSLRDPLTGVIDEFVIYDRALTAAEIMDHFESISAAQPGLQAGDANMDLQFNQLDLVKVQVAAKYLTGDPATWGEGDWNGAPGGQPGNPPAGDGLFNQIDIIAALNGGWYLKGPYAALAGPGGDGGDEQTSIIYDPATGELGVDAPASTELTSINIDSAAGIFTGDPAQNLGGSFDNDANTNIFKATFGGSFGSLSFGTVAQTGLSADFVANDLSVVGSLAGGGDLGAVDLIYVPEPSTFVLLGLALLALGWRRTWRGR